MHQQDLSRRAGCSGLPAVRGRLSEHLRAIVPMTDSDEALLDEHLAAENAHDLDRIMATYTSTRDA